MGETGWTTRLRDNLPLGLELPQAQWESRHRVILVVAWLHALVLPVFGWTQDWGLAYLLVEGGLIAAFTALAAYPRFSRRFRSALSGLALVTSSAALVQFSGGYIEAHFHYFIVVALIALYQDYVPFLLAIAYVALDHGIIGSLAPQWVYNHPAGAANPWQWAIIHAAAILAESVALLAFWAGAEQARARSDLVLDSAGEAVLGTDRDGRITFANPSASLMLAVPAGELIGMDVRPMVGGIVLAQGGTPARGEAVLAASGVGRNVEWSSTPTIRAGQPIGSVVVLRDVTEQRALERQVRVQARQQAAVAGLGQAALDAADLDAFFDTAVRTIASTLDVPLAKVLQLQPSGQRLRLRAGVGWQPGLVGLGTVSAGLDSQAGYTLRSNGAVMVTDLKTETRFSGPALLHDHGVVSGISVIIRGQGGPWGVLGAHSTSSRTFTSDDVNFLQAVANVLGGAIARGAVEHRLHVRHAQQAVVADLGQRALSGMPLDDFLQESARVVADALEVPFCKVLQLQHDGEAFLLRAGVGWQPGLVGKATVPRDQRSQASFALQHDGPVLVRDLTTDPRFSGPSLLHEHGVVSGLSVLIPGPQSPYGVLGAHTSVLREFSRDDVNFLQSVANLIGTAIERQRVLEELAQHHLNLEALVDRRTAQLQEANRELESFSYTVSHDLRSPLRAIDGFSRILAKRYEDALPEEGRHLLHQVSNAALRMGDLIESVLTLSRLSRVEFVHEPIDVTAMANAILDEQARKEPQRKVAWTVQEGLRAMGDPGLLRLALVNLLGNAWKFTARTPEARIEVRREEPSGAFVVSDNGAGFDMQRAGNLFQPFQRLHSAQEFEGTGVGLATVSRIVQRHGGRVWAESAPGEGARFFFTLAPAAQRSAKPTVTVRPRETRTRPTPRPVPAGPTTQGTSRPG